MGRLRPENAPLASAASLHAVAVKAQTHLLSVHHAGAFADDVSSFNLPPGFGWPFPKVPS